MAPRESTTPPSADRRQHPRLSVDWPVTIQLQDGQHEARLRDISRAGVCFFLDRRIQEMTVLGISLDLPAAGDDLHIEGRGVVVRCQPLSAHLDHYEVAVFFNELGQESRTHLDLFLGNR